MSSWLSRVSRRPTLAQIRHVRPVEPAAAGGLAADVYAQVERDFGLLAPPISLHSPAPEVMAAAWLMLRESMLTAGRASRAAKEAVAIAVSGANTCPYCVDVHSVALSGLAGSRQVARVTGTGRPVGAGGFGEGGELGELGAWARAGSILTVEQAPPPFPAALAPELVGTAVTFHYLNRMVNIFLVDSPLPAMLPGATRRTARRLFGTMLAPVWRRSAAPGLAADLLPAAPLPADLGWARTQPNVAAAFARAADALDSAGSAAPESVRELVTAALAGWDGRPPGLGVGWLRPLVSELPAPDRPAGRLALLAALASHQVTDSIVDDYRRGQPDDRRLIELTGWASMAAARHVGRWMWSEPGRPGQQSSSGI